MESKLRNVLFLIATVFATQGFGQIRTNPVDQSEELGEIAWYRDYDYALKLAKEQHKDVLILFQEVPGCATCRNYGHHVLSHPLLAEAVESLFVPVVVYNNKGGKDKVLLTKYNEPAWNNPVVRIVDVSGRNLIKRLAGDYSASSLAEAMILALDQQLKTAPKYLKLIKNELYAKEHHTEQIVYFKMYCFWSGEKHFGSLEGVLETESGFINHHEVVKVKYDMTKLNLENLKIYAKKANCELIKNNGTYKPSKNDTKYYLQHSDFKYIPLTNLQQSRVNSALGKGGSAIEYLSSTQKKWLEQVKSNEQKKEVLINKPFAKSWRNMSL